MATSTSSWGDGLLAVFGAPRRQHDHADQALAAALTIAERVEDEFGGERQIAVGLNSGTVVAGNVGGAGRLEFSVIGDAVNVAARVEAATRQTGDTVLIAERTRELLSDSGQPLDARTASSSRARRGRRRFTRAQQRNRRVIRPALTRTAQSQQSSAQASASTASGAAQ